MIIARPERSYLSRVVVARWPWILLMTAAVTGVAAAVAEMQTPMYRAQAEIAVYPASATSAATLPFVMGTEKGIASSGAVLSISSESLVIPESYLQRGLSISIPVDSDLLKISFTDPDPVVAQSAAESIAQAYVEYRNLKASPAVTANTPAPTAGAVVAAIITDAAVPASPIGPDRKLIIGLALLLGLALGVGLAFARDALDDGLRGPLDLQMQAETPLLAQIPGIKGKGRSLRDGLIVVGNPGSPVAEAYRNLRTRVLQAAGWRRSNALLITSPGTAGKDSVAANLAAALALSGRTVVLVCADMRWGHTQALFGVENATGLPNLVNGDARLAEALQPTEVPTLEVLPTGPPSDDPSSVVQSSAFRQLIGELRSEADVVVIDAPPVLAGPDTGVIAELGVMVLLVADARSTTRAEVQAATRELGHVRDELIGCVLHNAGRARKSNEVAQDKRSPTPAPIEHALQDARRPQEKMSIQGEG